MGLFKKRATVEEIEALKSEISSMAQRLAQADADTADLQRNVTAFSDELAAERESKRALESQMTEVGGVRDEIVALAQRLDVVDERLTSVSTELANQLTELSNDIADADTPEVATEASIGEVREAQERLANEQARYQIAFRKDLADLADRLRDPR